VRDGLISKTLFPDRVSVFSVSGEQQSATPQAAREWAHPPCTHLRSNLAAALGCFETNPPSSQRKIY
jgi:hypothetical protein